MAQAINSGSADLDERVHVKRREYLGRPFIEVPIDFVYDGPRGSEPGFGAWAAYYGDPPRRRRRKLVEPQRTGLEILSRLPNGYNADAEKRLKDELAAITIDISDVCAKAFKDAGLRDPMTLLIEKGVVIGTAQYLSTPELAKQAGITELARKSNFDAVGRTSVQGFTVRDKDGKQETLDGRVRIFFNNSAFGGGTYPLREVLVHEFIHAAGVPKTPSVLGTLGLSHDLSGYKHYDSIINDCK